MTLTFPKFSVIPWNMDSETMLIVFSVVDNGEYGVFPRLVWYMYHGILGCC